MQHKFENKNEQIGVLITNLGTPDSPTKKDLKKGEKGLICSFGAGYSVCSIIVEKV